jgi:hypothetical protein
MKTEAEITQACEYIRIGLTMNGDKVTTARLEAIRDALQWTVGQEGTRLGELVRRATAPAMTKIAEDIASALVNLAIGSRVKAEQIAQQVMRELPHADFEVAFKRALTIARP